MITNLEPVGKKKEAVLKLPNFKLTNLNRKEGTQQIRLYALQHQFQLIMWI